MMTDKKKKTMTKKERHARFLGIKRLFREKLSKLPPRSAEYRQSRVFISIMDRIGADHLEDFLVFVGARVSKSSIQMWTDVQKVDTLLNSLNTLRKNSK
jgi:hypothetical protein